MSDTPEKFDGTVFGGLAGWDFEGWHTGADTECWKRLGSHVVTVHDADGHEVTGTRFTVWAPNAQAVRLKASFNYYNPAQHYLRMIPGTGVWAIFVPHIGEGEIYKYEICTPDGRWVEKVDPMAQFAESAPHNGSIVHRSRYEWHDQQWLDRRAQARAHAEPMSIYEVHLGGWRKGLTYCELAEHLTNYVVAHGFTHVELMPVAEHPYEPSWGYQVTNYFAPQSRLGRPDELRYLIDRLHQAGIGVIVDWVPGHFPKDEWALGRFDGTALYEHADPRQGEHMDWGTYIFNFGRNEVKSFLVSNALYWIKEFHVDGLRVDAVASMLYLDYSRQPGQWVPNIFGGNENLEAIDFLRYVNKHLYEREPGVVMIAEDSTSFPGVTRAVHEGGLGFGFKWNMGWMNDSLRYIKRDPYDRQNGHHDITFATTYAFTENFILPISHDEVVHGKGSMINKVPQDPWRKFATLRAFYAYMWSFPGKQLLFMGNEFAQWLEFNETTSLDWPLTDTYRHHGLLQQFRAMNEIYKTSPALFQLDSSPEGFEWVVSDDTAGNTFAWLRYAEGARDGNGQVMACVVNFSPNPHREYHLGLPVAGIWKEVLNTDWSGFDGDDLHLNAGSVEAYPIAGSRWAAEATVVVPPLGAVWLELQREEH